MSRTQRLFDLMAALRRLPPPVTAEDLSVETGVSARTIYRDIETLRGLGVVIDGAAGFGYVMVEDNTLPPQAFDVEEIEAVFLGLKEVIARADPALTDAAQSAFAKLRARLPERMRAELLDDVMASHRFRPRHDIAIDEAALRRAIRNEDRITIRYTDGTGAQSERQVDPLIVLYLDDVRCLLANCHLRADFRAFRIDRIAAFEPTGASFRPHRRPMLRRYLDALKAAGQTPRTNA